MNLTIRFSLILFCLWFLGNHAMAKVDATVKGWNVAHVVYSGNNPGEFQYTGYNSWVEYKKGKSSPHARFTETHRDEWSVYLRKNDGARIQLDLHTKKVSVNRTAHFTITKSAVSPANGRNVTWVAYSALKPGFFHQTGPKKWQETKMGQAGVHATFTETGRDAWSVYLRKTDGARIQIDLHTKKIKVNNTMLGEVEDSRATMVAKPPRATNAAVNPGRNAGRPVNPSQGPTRNNGAVSARPPLRTSAYKNIQNRWKPNQYLHIEYGSIQSGPRRRTDWHSAQWKMIPVPGTKYVQFQNRWKSDQYLHIQNGKLESGRLGAPGWWSAHWELVKVPGTKYVQIRNRWKSNQYLHNETGKIQAGRLGAPGWWSAQWLVKNPG